MELIAELALHPLQEAFVVAVSWDMRMGKEILVNRNVGLRYDASGIGNLKPVLIVMNVCHVK